MLVLLVVVIAAAANDQHTTTARTKVTLVPTLTAPTDTDSGSFVDPETVSDTPTPATTVSVGSSVSITATNGDQDGEATYTVNAVKVNAHANDGFSTPEKGQFVVIDITVAGVSGSVDYNPFDFTLQTPDDKVWEPTFGPFDPEFHSGTVTAGQKVRGNLVFDIPKGDPGVLQLDGGSNGVVCAWKL